MSAKRALSLTFFVLLCFGLGFWIAQHPDLYLRSLQIGKNEIVIYYDDESFLSEKLRTLLQIKTRLKLNFTTMDRESASVWIIGYRHAKELNLDPQQFVAQKVPEIASDFNISEIEALGGLPLSWKAETKSLLIKVVFLPKKGRRYKLSPSHHFLLSTLFSPEFHRAIIAQTEWNSPLNLEISETPKDRNAAHIRNLDLRQITIH